VRKIASIITLSGLVLACANEVKEIKANSPISVARIWLENYYYTNDYELAKSYSTKETSAMIDTIKTMIFPDQLANKSKFEILNVQCKQKQSATVAECTCKYIEDGEPFTELLHLVQLEGQWLVDAQMGADNDLLKDDDIEKMSREFEKSLDQMLEQ